MGPTGSPIANQGVKNKSLPLTGKATKWRQIYWQGSLLLYYILIFRFVLSYDDLLDRGQTHRWRPINILFLLFNNNDYYLRQIDSMPLPYVRDRSNKAPKCGRNISGTQLSPAWCAIFSLLSHFDVICDLLLNRCTATWNHLLTTVRSGKFTYASKSPNFTVNWWWIL